MKTRNRTRIPTVAVALGASAALLVGCSSDNSSTDTQSAAPAGPRLTVSYDGGVMVLDADTLDVVDTVDDIDGFVRLNPAGDGRHVLVSTGNEFTALDTAEPALTDVSFPAEKPGHVVRHDGKTVLFDDGTGKVSIFDPITLSDGQPETHEHTTAEPHHGVAVELSDGTLVTTLGNEDERQGIVVLDEHGHETARSEECPGVHGEAVAANEAVSFGCENGALVVKDGAITKIASPDPYGRIGTQVGTEDSPILLGDYKTDPEAELERPERVSLIDTATNQMSLVELGASYSFRSLGRGPNGEALVLGTDGALHVIDPNTKAVTATIPVVEPWTEPEKWQDPRPTLFVQGGTAYVTDPATKKINSVDLASGKVKAEAELPETPNELTGVTG
ncbi:zinc metallochaperone AztD [Rhodococcus sp. NPDC058521]|uniref:zinc metallochaperone AztD n=1 Tax=Rhodococcus sp. NPDC058521 TaxID=3346536 RepID=UPI003652FA04